MGRGDKRSRRGKIFSASYGNVRKRITKVAKPAAKPAPVAAKKPAAKKSKES